MKLRYLLVFFITAAIALTSGYFYQSKINSALTPLLEKKLSSTPSPSQTPESSKAIKKTYFVPVTGLKNKILSISAVDLKNIQNLLVLKGEPDFFSQLSSTYTTTFEVKNTVEEIEKKLSASPLQLGLLPVDKLSFKVKALSIDSSFIFDRTTDLNVYPLVLTEEAQVSSSNYSHDNLMKFGHTGSMIPARGVVHYTETKYKGDYTRMFQSTKPLFDSFDFISSTFESPMLGKGNFCSSCMTFVGPDAFMEGVKYSGIDFYSLAANHIMNGGIEALANTQKLLTDAGIKHTGASTVNNDEAGKPVLVEARGLKIAFLGFNDSPGYEEWAKDNKPGAASISDVEWDTKTGRTTKYEPNEKRIEYFLQRAKDLKPDVIAVVMHWGSREYVAPKLSYQKVLADLLIKYGADVILGDHVHWVQEIEFNGNKPVFYGVGNYIFDQMWSTETRQGMTVEMNYVNKKLVNFRLHPHQLYLYDKGSVDLLKPEQPEYQQILDRVWNVSSV